MSLEPVLLKAPLTTVLYGFALALGTAEKGNVLLFEFLGISFTAITFVHMFLEHLLQWAHFIITLRDVDHLVVGAKGAILVRVGLQGRVVLWPRYPIVIIITHIWLKSC